MNKAQILIIENTGGNPRPEMVRAGNVFGFTMLSAPFEVVLDPTFDLTPIAGVVIVNFTRIVPQAIFSVSERIRIARRLPGSSEIPILFSSQSSLLPSVFV